MHQYPALSVVVPLFNEEASTEVLVRDLAAVLGPSRWELILIDDGSSDRTAAIALRLARRDRRVRLVRLARHYGQTAALQAGFDHARGDVVVSMDGDLQNDPCNIPALLTKLGHGYDLVTGYRESRQDHWLARRIPSWTANRLVRAITGVRIRDTGCTLRAYRRQLLERMRLYADMHRFVPAIAARTAAAVIAEIPVGHRPRRSGSAKYGLSRVLPVAVDLLTLAMITRFRERPLAIFAWAAGITSTVGIVFAGLTLVALNAGSSSATFLVLPGVSLLMMGLAFYLFMLGLVAEVALFSIYRADSDDLALVREESL